MHTADEYDLRNPKQRLNLIGCTGQLFASFAILSAFSLFYLYLDTLEILLSSSDDEWTGRFLTLFCEDFFF